MSKLNLLHGFLVSLFQIAVEGDVLDPVGNRTSAIREDGSVTLWQYDADYQLTREQKHAGSSELTWLDMTLEEWLAFTLSEWLGLDLGDVLYSTSYQYDAAGNRLVADDADNGRTTYTYDAANRLLTSEDVGGVTTFSYDAVGNRTQKETPTTQTDYAWDETNRLAVAEPVAGPVTLTKSADGRRVRTETSGETRKFIYDFRKLLQETDGDDGPLRTYTQTTEEYGDLVSEFDEGAGESLYHEYDAVGSTEALLDPAEGGPGDILLY